MDWRERIVADQEILAGKPVVRGTRLSADFLLELLEIGWRYEQIFESYPNLTAEDLQAVVAFARECVRDEEFVMAEEVLLDLRP